MTGVPSGSAALAGERMPTPPQYSVRSFVLFLANSPCRRPDASRASSAEGVMTRLIAATWTGSALFATAGRPAISAIVRKRAELFALVELAAEIEAESAARRGRRATTPEVADQPPIRDHL